MLVLLLIDSAMNDPDVQPVVDHQFMRAQHRIEAISGWIRSTPLLPWNGDSEATAASKSAQTDQHDGHGWSWYWSTSLGLAAATVSLAKSVTTEIAIATAVATLALQVGVHLTGRRS